MLPVHPSVAWMLPADPEDFAFFYEMYQPGSYLAWPHGSVQMPKYRGKTKDRRLWLNVKAENVTVSKQEFIRALMESINDGTYELPKDWDVRILWKNKERAKMRGDYPRSWKTELKASAKSSKGFDTAVTAWLKRKLR